MAKILSIFLPSRSFLHLFVFPLTFSFFLSYFFLCVFWCGQISPTRNGRCPPERRGEEDPTSPPLFFSLPSSPFPYHALALTRPCPFPRPRGGPSPSALPLPQRGEVGDDECHHRPLHVPDRHFLFFPLAVDCYTEV
jgi:hypothetical protein